MEYGDGGRLRAWGGIVGVGNGSRRLCQLAEHAVSRHTVVHGDSRAWHFVGIIEGEFSQEEVQVRLIGYQSRGLGICLDAVEAGIRQAFPGQHQMSVRLLEGSNKGLLLQSQNVSLFRYENRQKGK